MIEIAAGDFGLLAGLVALRRVENGPPGNQFGVMSIRDAFGQDAIISYADELRVARNSLRNREQEWRNAGLSPRAATGFFTDAFLRAFSARWAPLGASNDPHALNRHHAPNLCAIYRGLAERLSAAAHSLPRSGDVHLARPV